MNNYKNLSYINFFDHIISNSLSVMITLVDHCTRSHLEKHRQNDCDKHTS